MRWTWLALPALMACDGGGGDTGGDDTGDTGDTGAPFAEEWTFGAGAIVG